ncbi:MAG: glycoside hydrolase family 5 protein [Asticcacaulis sp.]
MGLKTIAAMAAAFSLLAGQTVASQALAQTQAKTPEVYKPAIAFEAITPEAQVADMGAGVNLFENVDPYFDGKPTWFEDADIQRIADAGFKTIRVPLLAFSHISDGEGNLDPAYMKRIDHLIDLATAAKLNIILDEHNSSECNTKVDACGVLLSNVWYDLALRYQKAPSNVMFELLNEPNGELDATVWNGWLPTLIAQVRQFNPKRNIIVGPTLWNGAGNIDTLKLPAEDRHLIVTFHYYDPFAFTHQGASWAGPEIQKLHDIRWEGKPEDIAAINTTFDKVKAWSEANNRPIFLGEFGSYAVVNKNMEDRAAWTRAVSKAAADRGFARALWVYKGSPGFGIYDPGKGWVTPLKDALLLK